MTSNHNEKEVDVNSINTQNESEGEASCSELQFEELLSVTLRGSDCVGVVFTMMKYVLLRWQRKRGRRF